MGWKRVFQLLITRYPESPSNECFPSTLAHPLFDLCFPGSAPSRGLPGTTRGALPRAVALNTASKKGMEEEKQVYGHILNIANCDGKNTGTSKAYSICILLYRSQFLTTMTFGLIKSNLLKFLPFSPGRVTSLISSRQRSMVPLFSCFFSCFMVFLHL